MAGVKKWKPRPFRSSTTSINTKSSSTSSIYFQLCDKEGNLAKSCWNVLKLKKKQSANLVEAFFVCSIQDLNNPEWFLDSSATSHTKNNSDNLEVPTTYSSNERVMVVWSVLTYFSYWFCFHSCSSKLISFV
jgi:hypothetical protein